MAQMLDHALAYAKRGLPVFPCDAKKKPLCENGVLDATTDPGRIEKWWSKFPKANIGCDVTGGGLCVVDFDPGSDIAQVKRDLKLPATEMRQRTPRGGIHLFYAIDESVDRVANSVSTVAHKMDVRGLNGYVLLAPSRTGDGVYSWEAEGAATFRTDDMLRVFNTAREKDADRDNWLIEPDLPENVEAATKWLQEDAKIAVEGQGGDHMAYATAAHMKSYGISQELAFDLIWEHWNPRCDPPWSAEEVDHLETKINNGYSYNTSPPGNITKAYKEAKAKAAFRPVLREGMPSGREFTAGRFRIVDREGMNHIPPAKWIIPGLIPQDAYVVMFGAPGTFKSFIAFDIAATVATGASFPWSGAWGDVTEDGAVLYALGEGRSGFTKRVKAWEKVHWKGKQIENFFLCDPVPLASEPLDAFIEGALAASPDGYRLVFVDTVGRSMQGLNENSQEHASKFTAMVQRIQAELGATVVAIHHSGHDEEKRGKGSMEFYGAPDATFGVMRKDKEMFVDLVNPKQKDAPEWEKPRRLQLQVVDLGNGEDSLVVMPAGAKPESPAVASAKQKRADVSVVLVLDGLVAKVLEANKVKAWSTRELAQAIAMRDEMEVDSKTLQNTHLVRLREMKGTKANRSYDPHTKRWKWRD